MTYKEKSLGQIVKETLYATPSFYLGFSIGTAYRTGTTFVEALTDGRTLVPTLSTMTGYFAGKLLYEGGRKLYYSHKEKKEKI